MLHPPHKSRFDEALEARGLRSTPHREEVFAALLAQRDHPTADEVFARVREVTPAISLATVYNCLDTLVSCGLVRSVACERAPVRYCPNLAEHGHFHDEKTGQVLDVDLTPEIIDRLREALPSGYLAKRVEIHFHGHSACTN